jgi:hypothetical protein
MLRLVQKHQSVEKLGSRISPRNYESDACYQKCTFAKTTFAVVATQKVFAQ